VADVAGFVLDAERVHVHLFCSASRTCVNLSPSYQHAPPPISLGMYSQATASKTNPSKMEKSDSRHIVSLCLTCILALGGKPYE